MNSEKVLAAEKEVKARKPAENFMVISMGYDSKLILPHKAGVALMAALKNAELFKDSWSDKCRIIPLERDSISTGFLSIQEYHQIKIANLLGVSLTEIQNPIIPEQ